MSEKRKQRKTEKGGFRSARGYLLTGGLLILAAAASLLLPERILAWQDEHRLGTIRTEETQEVVLSEQTDLSITEKLGLLCSPTVNNLTLVNGTYFTQETVVDQVDAEMKRLQELGILPEGDWPETRQTSPDAAFFMDMEDSRRSLILWNGLSWSEAGSLEWILDDETGRFLGFSWRINEESVYDRIINKAETGMIQKEVSDEPPLSQLAQAWADYLDCRLTETDSAGEIYPEDVNVKQRAGELVKKGLSPEEALKIAREEYGYVGYGEGGDVSVEDAGGYGEELLVTLEDDCGSILYHLQKLPDGGLTIYCMGP